MNRFRLQQYWLLSGIYFRNKYNYKEILCCAEKGRQFLVYTSLLNKIVKVISFQMCLMSVLETIEAVAESTSEHPSTSASIPHRSKMPYKI